jgi:hypothetical protein
MRNEKDAALAGDVGEAADVWQQALCTGYIELSARQHEVCLRINFPENKFARCQCASNGRGNSRLLSAYLTLRFERASVPRDFCIATTILQITAGPRNNLAGTFGEIGYP